MTQGARHTLDGLVVNRPLISMPEPGYAAHAVSSTLIRCADFMGESYFDRGSSRP
jgi:hypothetical protein